MLKNVNHIHFSYYSSYRICSNFSDGLAVVAENGKHGFINKQGKVVVPCIYNDVTNFQEGMARVQKNGKYGFVDNQGNEVIPCNF